MTGLQKHLPHRGAAGDGLDGRAGQPQPRLQNSPAGRGHQRLGSGGSELEGIGGLYLEDVQEALPVDPSRPYVGYLPYLRDAEKAQRLWDESEKLVGLK